MNDRILREMSAYKQEIYVLYMYLCVDQVMIQLLSPPTVLVKNECPRINFLPLSKLLLLIYQNIQKKRFPLINALNML